MITERSKSVIPFRPGDAGRVGEGCFYLDAIVWLNGDRVEMGDRVGFNYGCYVNGYGGLTIGHRSIFGPYSMIHTANHEMDLDAPIPDQGWEPAAWSWGRTAGSGWGLHPPRRHHRGWLRGGRGSGRRQGPRALLGRRREPARAIRDRRAARVRVLFLQRQPCIRALKYAVGLRAARPEMALGFAYQGRTLDEWYGSGDDLFEAWWRLDADDPAEGLAAAIDEFDPTLIHSHNLPDSLTVLALEVVDGRIPVIHDSHDLQSLRRTPYEDGFDDPDDPEALEKAAVEGCAALVAVSREMVDEIAARHRVPERTLLFANYALARDVAPFPRARRDGRSGSCTRAALGQRQPLRPARRARRGRGRRAPDRRLPEP